MRLTKRTRQAIETLLALARALPDEQVDWSEYPNPMKPKEAADILGYVLSKNLPTAKWELIAVGKIVRCACGDPCCYRGIEVGQDGLVFYEDVSDRSAPFLIIDLPPKAALMKDVSR